MSNRNVLLTNAIKEYMNKYFNNLIAHLVSYGQEELKFRYDGCDYVPGGSSCQICGKNPIKFIYFVTVVENDVEVKKILGCECFANLFKSEDGRKAVVRFRNNIQFFSAFVKLFLFFVSNEHLKDENNFRKFVQDFHCFISNNNYSKVLGFVPNNITLNVIHRWVSQVKDLCFNLYDKLNDPDFVENMIAGFNSISYKNDLFKLLQFVNNQ